jgi:hypothetical protein
VIAAHRLTLGSASAIALPEPGARCADNHKKLRGERDNEESPIPEQAGEMSDQEQGWKPYTICLAGFEFIWRASMS